MITLKGKYNEALVNSSNLSTSCTNRLIEILNSKSAQGEVCRGLKNCEITLDNNLIGYSQTYTPENPINPSLLGSRIGFGVGIIETNLIPVLSSKIISSKSFIGEGTKLKTTLPALEEKNFKKYLRDKLQGIKGKVGGLVKFEMGLGNIDKFISDFCRRIELKEEYFWRSLGKYGDAKGNYFPETFLGIVDEEDIRRFVYHSGCPLCISEAVYKYWGDRVKKGWSLMREMKSAEKEIKKSHRGYEGEIKEKIQALHKSKKFTIPPSDLLVYPSDLTGYLEDIFTLQFIAEWNNFYLLTSLMDKYYKQGYSGKSYHYKSAASCSVSPAWASDCG